MHPHPRRLGCGRHPFLHNEYILNVIILRSNWGYIFYTSSLAQGMLGIAPMRVTLRAAA